MEDAPCECAPHTVQTIILLTFDITIMISFYFILAPPAHSAPIPARSAGGPRGTTWRVSRWPSDRRGSHPRGKWDSIHAQHWDSSARGRRSTIKSRRAGSPRDCPSGLIRGLMLAQQLELHLWHNIYTNKCFLKCSLFSVFFSFTIKYSICKIFILHIYPLVEPKT